MYFLITLFLCVGLVKGPPPWLNPDVSRAFRLKHFSQTPSPAHIPISCPLSHVNDKIDSTLKEREFPCASEKDIWDSAVVQLLVRGPDKQCEHGNMCSVKVGSKLHIEASSRPVKKERSDLIGCYGQLHHSSSTQVSLSSAPPSLGLSLALCSLSPSSDPFNYSHTLLVVNGCPADGGVSLTMAPPLPYTKTLLVKSFSFKLAPFYNNPIQFLHCRVQVCNKETSCSAGSENIPECHNTEDLCTPLSAAPLFLRPELQRTVTQPLLVTISDPTDPLVQPSTGHKKLPVSKHQGENRHEESATHGVGMAAAVGVTISSFFFGVILIAGLWCIHSKTAPTTPVTQSSREVPQDNS